jgi:hypothetical protein
MIRRLERNVGKLLFPRSESWQRKQKVRVIVAVLLIEAVIAVVVVALVVMSNSKWK